MGEQTNQSIGKWISVLHRQAQAYLGRELKPYGLNASEYIYLVNIAKQKSAVNQKQLSDMIMIDGALTTRAMKSLEAKGFIRRTKNADDQRAYEISLTARGWGIQPVIMQTLGRWTEIISQGVSAQDRDLIVEKLMAMSQNALKAARGE